MKSRSVISYIEPTQVKDLRKVTGKKVGKKARYYTFIPSLDPVYNFKEGWEEVVYFQEGESR